MNRKEIDLIAKAMHMSKPSSKASEAANAQWSNSVMSIVDRLKEKGHIVGETSVGRCRSIADHGVIRDF